MKDFKIFQLVEAFRKGIMVEMNKKLTMLMILDGFGNNQNKNGNAIEMAEIPNINKLKKTCPVTEIYTSGLDVGLPEGQMGNSEVGHTNIGAGLSLIHI